MEHGTTAMRKTDDGDGWLLLWMHPIWWWCAFVWHHTRGATARPSEAGTAGPGRPGRRSIVGLVARQPASSRRRLRWDGMMNVGMRRCVDWIRLDGTARLTHPPPTPPIPLHRRIARSRRSTHSQVNRIGGAAGWCVSRPGVHAAHTTPKPPYPQHSIPHPNRTTPPTRHEQKLEDAYQVLGLEMGASEEEVKKAYRKLALVRLMLVGMCCVLRSIEAGR